ncbi:putative hydrocarbon binding protein [Bacillus mesophilus]|uniref:YslB family protein n=1 Tax=Bacillus mesophilus TaxID=1808955 RepID=A0A6M0Q6B5_9BACI|nr:YslB family protein [Bacillus mesophilus]MBM7660618.1 putative hydrocarbon binding protein [Bacillus mesophilus]NEY71834.1 YslB family protein [Bacillus mesophilus]
MKQSSVKDQLSQFEHLHTSGIAYELIREILIPDLLGQELPSILYWSGKNIARKYPLSTIEEIIQFFKDAGWGELSILEQKSSEIQFELSGDFITARNQSRKGVSYQLEAGFIAQQIEFIQQMLTEAFEEQKKRHNKVLFTARWDKKDPLI